MATLLIGISAAALCYFAGRLYRGQQLLDLARVQKDRGDYWYEQYRAAVRDEWQSESSEGID